MPPNSFTYNFDQMLSTTLMNMKDTLTDNIYNAIPLYWWIHRKDHKKTEDGGERIVLPQL